MTTIEVNLRTPDVERLTFMLHYWRSLLPLFLLPVALSSLNLEAEAQIIPDQTLGAENSRVTPLEPGLELIEGGAIRGRHLFHSFREFNIQAGNSAYFANPEAIQTIFSRVTGNNPSQLLGKLGVLGNANLFFINPHGIIFGPNSSLDIRGAFVASTASSIIFPDGNQFSATHPHSAPLLTIEVTAPVGLRFESDSSGTIINAGNLATEKNLALIGTTIVSTGQLLTPTGEITLLTTSPGVETKVQLDETGRLLGQEIQPSPAISTSADSVSEFIRQEGATTLETGDIAITGSSPSISLLAQRANLSAANNLTLVDSQILLGGHIDLNAGNIVSLRGTKTNDAPFSPRGITVLSSGAGDQGGINITAGSFSATDGFFIRNFNSGEGNGGNVTINVKGTISFHEFSGVASVVLPGATGKSGDIKIIANSLSLTNGSILSTLTIGQGNAGNIDIDVRENVTISRGTTVNVQGTNRTSLSGISASTGPGAEGNAGDIKIKANSLILSERSTIGSDNITAQGNGGDILIQVDNLVDVTESTISSTITGGTGIGGDINIQARSLNLNQGSQIATSLARSTDVFPGAIGKAGNIYINATDSVNISGVSTAENPPIDPQNPTQFSQIQGFSSGLVASTETGASGDAGNITVNTNALNLSDAGIVETLTANDSRGGDVIINAKTFTATGGAQVNTTTSGSGGAGNIILNISDSTTISGQDPTFADRLAQFPDAVTNQGAESGLFTQTQNQGIAGNITINTPVFNLDDTAIVSAKTSNLGDGGNIIINAPQTLDIRGQGKITVESQGSGIGGDIQIFAYDLTLDEGTIFAQTASNTGGNITLNIDNLLSLKDSSQISSTAGTAQAGGNGGNINIDASFIVSNLYENNDITANAFTGNGGNINITAQGILGLTVSQDLTDLSDITASSRFGLDGNILINTAIIDPLKDLVNLPEQTVDIRLNQGCQATSQQAKGEFYTLGRGGLSTNLDEFFSDNLEGNWTPWVESSIEAREDSERFVFSSENYQKLILPCQNNQ